MKDYDIKAEYRGSIVDVAVVGGDIALGDTLQQNVGMILQSFKGDWKEYPTLGVAIGECVGDENPTAWKREAVEQLRRDGMTVGPVVINGDNINIRAKY